MPLAKFVITKQLTKRPEDYPDARNQPHVQVALRRRAAGLRNGTMQVRIQPGRFSLSGCKTAACALLLRRRVAGLRKSTMQQNLQQTQCSAKAWAANISLLRLSSHHCRCPSIYLMHHPQHLFH